MARPGRKPQILDTDQRAAAITEAATAEAVDAQNDRSRAFAVRAAWMAKMGFSDEEIAAACRDDGSPISLADEQENLRAADDLKKITPDISVLETWAVKR